MKKIILLLSLTLTVYFTACGGADETLSVSELSNQSSSPETNIPQVIDASPSETPEAISTPKVTSTPEATATPAATPTSTPTTEPTEKPVSTPETTEIPVPTTEPNEISVPSTDTQSNETTISVGPVENSASSGSSATNGISASVDSTTSAENSSPVSNSSAQSTIAGTGGGNGNESNFNTYNNVEQQNTEAAYVLNTNTKKIHHPSCKSVKKIAPQNYSTSNLSVEELINQGYSTCGNCFK